MIKQGLETRLTKLNESSSIRIMVIRLGAIHTWKRGAQAKGSKGRAQRLNIQVVEKGAQGAPLFNAKAHREGRGNLAIDGHLVPQVCIHANNTPDQVLWEVKGEKPLHQQVMPGVVICSCDIQEDTVGGLLEPQVMVSQVLQGEHVM
jgi:hypothetical protein